jgi:phosphoglycolate phosphatase-like HAD superfamily hydrolase
MKRHALLRFVLCIISLATSFDAAAESDPLPAWNDGHAKRSIVEFVRMTTSDGSAQFIPSTERIAVFDNDGTLWAEQPLYFQFAFALDRVRALAPQHPEWKDKEPFRSILNGDIKAALAGGEKSVAALVLATHTGLSTEEFETIVKTWISSAKHPKTGKLYTQMVYQPMLELLSYLRANGYKTYIVSGGGVEFMRPWVERVYGITPEQIVGSRGKLKFEVRGEKPVLTKLAEIDLINDGPGKPVGIQQVIGRRPVMAFGNSDGDLQMLQWTAAGAGPRFCLFVHHTDADREWAYDRHSHIGKLDKGLDEAKIRKWVVADMKNDWKTIFPIVE